MKDEFNKLGLSSAIQNYRFEGSIEVWTRAFRICH